MTAADVKHLEPLPGQALTEEDRRRLRDLGGNGDAIDPNVWGKHTSSVTNYRASAEEVLAGMRGVPSGR